MQAATADVVALRDGALGDSELGPESRAALERVLKALGSAGSGELAPVGPPAAGRMGRRGGGTRTEKETAEWLAQQYNVKSVQRKKKARRSSYVEALGLAGEQLVQRNKSDMREAMEKAAADSKWAWMVADDTRAALQGFQQREWDVFELERVVGKGRVLTAAASCAFQTMDMHSLLPISREVVARWASVVEECYDNSGAVPYHNSTHAADVLQTLMVYILQTGMVDWLTEVELLALLVAAVTHDVGHPGRNNAFQVARQTPVALRYNDRAVLESMHSAMAFELMREREDIDLLADLAEEDKRRVRKLVIDLVALTDMAEHFNFIARFSTKVQANIDVKNADDRLALMQIAMKCADISNPTKTPDYARKWAMLMLAEFHAQGDEEKALGMKVSPLCCRETADVPRSQVNFIKIVLLPLYEAWATYAPAAKGYLESTQKVLAAWQEELDSNEAKKAES